MPKVSVIVPNYNHAGFVGRRIESILKQTYVDFELVVLDDASTDNSCEVIRGFQNEPRLRFIECQPNSGNTFVQWNRGVAMTGGEYVWIAESDDYAAPALLETLVSRLDRFPKAGLACCNSWIVDERGKILGSTDARFQSFDKQHWTCDSVGSGVDECRRYLAFECTIPNASAVVFRRSLYDAVGGADESYKLCGDWAFWIDVAIASDIAFVADRLNFYRRHAQTVRRKMGDRIYLGEMTRIRTELAQRLSFSPAELRRLRNDFRVRRLKAWIASIPLLGPLVVELKQTVLDPRLQSIDIAQAYDAMMSRQP
jgi:glycosyltransferase involved in cell wall biosynthesis